MEKNINIQQALFFSFLKKPIKSFKKDVIRETIKVEEKSIEQERMLMHSGNNGTFRK